MNTPDCEQVRQTTMALADGERAELTRAQIEAHLANCAECRHEAADMTSLSGLLAAQRRRRQSPDVWPAIRLRLTGAAERRRDAGAAGLFLALALVLFSCRGLVLSTDTALAWLVKLVALVLVAGLFFLRRENPFALNRQLAALEEKP